MRVLIVEDDEAIRETMATVVENFGYEVHVATGVETGLEAVAQLRPRVILLDLLLNGNVSTEFIDAARQMSNEVPPPTIIIVSAMGGAHHIAAAHGTGFLRKPFDVDELEAILKKEEPQTKPSEALEKHERERKPPEAITSRDRSVP